MNEVVITMGVSSGMLTIIGTIVNVVPIKGVGNVVGTRLVVKKMSIHNGLSPCF